MIGATIGKDLRLVVRDSSCRAAILGYLLMFPLASFAFFLSALAADRQALALLFPRIIQFQTLVLMGVTPWLMLRLTRHECGNALALQIAYSSAMPWRAILGKLIAAMAILAALVGQSFPVLLLAHLMGAADYFQIGYSLLDLFLLLLVLAVLILHVRMLDPHWVICWILSYAAVAGLAYCNQELLETIGLNSVLTLLALWIALLTLLLLFRGNHSLVHLRT
jgi:hypothetical protein